MNCPDWIYRWVDEIGQIPSWVIEIWPKAHWCPELDDLLVIEPDRYPCCCDISNFSDTGEQPPCF